MDNKPALDRSVFIPIFLGFASVMGICLVLFAARLGAARGTVQEGETETPIKFQYLATEPGIALPTEAPPATGILETDTPAPTPLFFPPTLTPTLLSTLVVPLKTTNASATVSSTPLALNVIYDDADFNFNYTGNWIGQSGVNGTYQNTLHVSSTIGDSVQLSFVGQKIRIAYQAGPSLGTIAIKLDNIDFTLDQFDPETIFGEWESPVLVLSSHSITITHISGGSVNLDSITVLDIATPTPAPTPTITSTSTRLQQ
jgi:hypothetical protein